MVLQVKKEILEKFGLSRSPGNLSDRCDFLILVLFGNIYFVLLLEKIEKTVRRTKSIAAFFSKRCLPPAGKTTNPNQVSPQPMEKAPQAAAFEIQNQNNTYTNQ